MDAADPLKGRVLHLKVDLRLSPAPGREAGHTDAAAEIGRRLALELGLMARQMGGEGCRISVERTIKVY